MSRSGFKRYWPQWWWRYPFSTGIFSPWVPEDYEPYDGSEGFFFASATPVGGSPPPDAAPPLEEKPT